MNALLRLGMNHGIIDCPGCKKDLYYVRNWKDVKSGDTIPSDVVLLQEGIKAPVKGERIRCPLCTTEIYSEV